ncbi:MAG TPA: MipA/OmpV family protein [Burkholderiaceae bacterium]|jgi:outer membrane scaffolding protein for murein synthesis (MipA/OmpV family)
MIHKIHHASKIIICVASLLPISLCHAEDRPLWEAGVGVGVITLPDYRGSNQSHTYVLPVPYFVYRGEYLKADRNGVRGMLYHSDSINLNISVGGNIPVHSKDNDARRGMADLKPAIEVGPTANFTLWRAADKKTKLEFRAPLRTGITVESSPKDIGWVFAPSLNLDIKDPAGMSGWNLSFLAGPIFNDRKYNDHFYSVSAADATPTRPAYQARGGFAGSQATMAISKRFPRFWVGGYTRYDSLAGAVFKDSPLVKKQNTISAGFAIAWVFNQSGQLVKVADD